MLSKLVDDLARNQLRHLRAEVDDEKAIVDVGCGLGHGRGLALQGRNRKGKAVPKPPVACPDPAPRVALPRPSGLSKDGYVVFRTEVTQNAWGGLGGSCI